MISANTMDEAARLLDEALTPGSDMSWMLQERGYHPARESSIESRFAIGNGFLGVRASRAISRGPMWVSWSHTLSWASWPRTYIAGLFDTPNIEPPVPALVPGPDWLRLRLLLDGQPLLLRAGQVLEHTRTLDMRRGMLLSQWRHRDPAGRVVAVRSLRLASLADRAIGLQAVEITIDRVAEITLEALMEAAGSGLEPVHLAAHRAVWRTAGSGKTLAIANRAELRIDGQALAEAAREPLRQCWSWTADPGQTAVFWRLAAFARDDGAGSRVGGEPDAPERVGHALDRAARLGWRWILGEHERAWDKRWAASDIEVEGDEEAQRALRFAAYHLTIAANPADERVSIGARALTGDAYLGHVFWDTEVYLLPFYTLTWPEAARALLMYRFHTLSGARAKAAGMGYRGAMYAWESADTGEETTPEHIIDPNGRPIEVLCGRQEQHISADVAYAVWHYWMTTGDDSFLLEAGAEIIFETARFWASRAEGEPDGFHIRGVIGPDEYHEHIDDNAFTNVMAGWNLRRGLDVASLLRRRWPERWEELTAALGLVEGELQRWRTVAEGLVTGFRAETGLFEQFAGYFELEEIDLSLYEGRAVPMDVVLGRERTQRSKVLKQADVVALMVMLPGDFSPDIWRANFDYYEPRCGHGSSLSRGFHAVAAARLGRSDLALQYFHETAAIDMSPVAAGSADGVHIAALGGLWQAAIFGFAGLGVQADGLSLDPHLPDGWRSLTFRAQWRGRCARIRVGRATPRIVVDLEMGDELTIRVGGEVRRVQSGTAETFA